MAIKTTEMVYTSKQIKSSKWLLLLCAAGAAAVDAVIIAMLFLGGSGAAYFVCPFILLGLDVIYFIVSLFFTNFRFKYSLLVWISYVILFTAGLSVGIGIVLGGTGTVITNVALILWACVHGACIICAIVMALLASRVVKNIWVALVITVIDLVACVLYSGYVLDNGFLGQGVNFRPLVYSYDKETQEYTVKEVLAGNSKQVNIPATFNGKRVTALSYGVLADSGITDYYFDTDVKFVDAEVLEGELDLSGKTINVQKESVNAVRDSLYAYGGSGHTKENAVALANNVLPAYLDEGEGYVSFKYDMAAYEACDGKVIPVYVGDLKEFNLSTFAKAYPYVSHRNSESVSDLNWAYENGGQILTDIKGDDGKSLFGSSLNSSTVAEVTFEKVYKVVVGSGNDTKYDVHEKQPEFCYDKLGNNSLTYRLVTEKTAANMLGKLNARNGFNLNWRYSTKAGSTSTTKFTALPSLLKSLTGNLVYIQPEWELKAPAVTVSTDATSNTLTYGNDVTFTSAVELEAEGVALQYEWLFGSKALDYTTPNVTLVKPKVAEGGEYSLSVTAGNDEITSLTAKKEYSFRLNVQRKTLDFVWDNDGVDGTQSLVPFTYNAQDQGVKLLFDDTQIVGADELTYKATCPESIYDYATTTLSVKNAGSYDINVELGGADSGNYAVNRSVATTLTVNKYKVAVDWSSSFNDSFTYDGKVQTPYAEATGLLDDGPLIGAESGKDYGGVEGCGKDAGTYNVVAYTNNTNYELTNKNYTYEIKKKDVTVSASDFNDSFTLTYGDGVPNTISVGYEGFVQGDTPENSFTGTRQLNFTQSVIDNKNRVGYYEAGMVLSGWTSRNYNIIYETTPLNIIARKITYVWENDRNLTYDSTEKTVTARITNKVGDDDVSCYLTDNAQTDAGSYTARLSGLDGADSANYTFDEATHAYSIAKAKVTISAQNASSVYGEPIKQVTASVTSGRIYNNEFTYSAEKESGDQADTYQITCSYADNPNYDVTLRNATYTITKRTVGVEWSGQKTYDYDSEVKTVTATVTNKIGNDDVRFDVSNGSNTQASSYTARVALAGTAAHNYQLPTTNTTYAYEIKKADVTFRAEDKNIVYGDSDVDLTATVEGTIYNNEVTYSLSRESGKNAGEYIIHCSIAKFNVNYNVKAFGATYTIAPREVQLTWNCPANMVYNGTATNVTATVANKVGSDDVTIVVTGGREVNAGTDHVATAQSLSGTAAGNYVLPQTGLTQGYAILQRNITVHAAPKETKYGDPLDTNFEPIIGGGGILDQDKDSIAFSFTKAGGLNFGTYDISCEVTKENPNYHVTCTNGTYTISKRKIRVYAQTTSFEYDGNEHTVEILIDNIVEGDRGLVRYADATKTAAGEYTATVTLDAAIVNNYEFENGKNTIDWTIVNTVKEDVETAQ